MRRTLLLYRRDRTNQPTNRRSKCESLRSSTHSVMHTNVESCCCCWQTLHNIEGLLHAQRFHISYSKMFLLLKILMVVLTLVNLWIWQTSRKLSWLLLLKQHWVKMLAQAWTNLCFFNCGHLWDYHGLFPKGCNAPSKVSAFQFSF